MITNLDSEPIKVKENYFGIVTSPVNHLLPPKEFGDAVYRYCLSKLNIVFDVFGGHDFGKFFL